MIGNDPLPQKLEIAKNTTTDPKTMMMKTNNSLTSFLKKYTESTVSKIFSTKPALQQHYTLSSTTTSKTTECHSDESSDAKSSTLSYISEEYQNPSQFMTTRAGVKVEEMDVDEKVSHIYVPKNSAALTVSKLTFTIDDIPPSRWAERFQEFHSWLETKRLSKNSYYTIRMKFVSRFTGTLRNW
ncbi:Uncharacterized protein TCM_002850 [Theobroma cacao]|uniref:Uncharacterized protein n=1 Tax=Theobroma cacao TaxID=3641 RepID=A0A061DN61_THECC|nr:Uncharacterized protein TCM_002850 [Theobroma cacao]